MQSATFLIIEVQLLTSYYYMFVFAGTRPTFREEQLVKPPLYAQAPTSLDTLGMFEVVATQLDKH